MIAKILPILFLLTGTGAGVGVAQLSSLSFSQSKPPVAALAKTEGSSSSKNQNLRENSDTEFARLSNQFVVPIVDQNRVSSMIVVSLSLEVETGSSETVYSKEPKLRDAFLRVLFDHANMGGFSGRFTDTHRLELLRNALQEVASKELGSKPKVLITDIARQDTQ